MECEDIGQANPDIAGVGILVAFVAQSLIAVLVSAYTFLLSSIIQQRWDEADPEPQSEEQNKKWASWIDPLDEVTKVMRRTIWWYLRFYSWLFQRLTGRWPRQSDSDEQQIPRTLDLWPTWLVGKQPEYPRQRDETSKVEDEITPTTRRLDLANRVLLAGSDTQTFTGIALLISALIQSKSLTLYHMHIIYDTISLVIISNCAACICIFREGRTKGYIRLVLIATWAILFIAYLAVFQSRLRQWDNEVPSQCYRTNRLALPNSKHPYVDHIYISVTTTFIASTFIYAMFLALNLDVRIKELQQNWQKTIDALVQRNPRTFTTLGSVNRSIFLLSSSSSLMTISPATMMQRSILSVAMLQCPLHIYSIFALRASNEKFLDEGASEQEWGFGQIAAMILLGNNVLQIVDGITSVNEEHSGLTALNVEQRREGDGMVASETVGTLAAPSPAMHSDIRRRDVEDP